MSKNFRKVNLNDEIKVKLTDFGKQIYYKYCEDFPTKLKIDSKGYTKFQIWVFMHIFGEYLYNGCVAPCETDVQIQIEDNL